MSRTPNKNTERDGIDIDSNIVDDVDVSTSLIDDGDDDDNNDDDDIENDAAKLKTTGDDSSTSKTDRAEVKTIGIGKDLKTSDDGKDGDEKQPGEFPKEKSEPKTTSGSFAKGGHNDVRSSIQISSYADSSDNAHVPGAFAIENPLATSQSTFFPGSVATSTIDTYSNPDSNSANNTVTMASVTVAATASLQEDAETGRGHVVEAVRVDNQQLVEAKIVSQDDGSVGGASRVRICTIMAALVLLTIVATLSIVLTQKEEGAEPTISPSVIQYRTEAMRAIVAPISGGEEVFDENSPTFSLHRKAALDWLVLQDRFATGDPNIEVSIVQSYILAVFYYSTGGPNWTKRYLFLSEASECDWSSVNTREVGWLNAEPWEVKGIICNHKGRVEKIRMWWNGLSGTLPHEVSHFSDSLTEILVGGGQMSGTIPEAYTNLSRLEHLAVNDHCLTGAIPDFSKSPNFKYLNVFKNSGLYGSLNEFCNGTEFRSSNFVVADCGGCNGEDKSSRIECDCCQCCSEDDYICCNTQGDVYKAVYLNELNEDGFLTGFDKQCISEKAEAWIQEECPCVINLVTENSEVPFVGECVTCDTEGARRSYDY